MAKWVKIALCILIAVATVVGTEYILNIFQTPGTVSLPLDIEGCELIDSEGVSRPADMDFPWLPEDWHEGETLHLTIRMPDSEEAPWLYEEGLIYFAVDGAEIRLLVDGQEVYRSSYLDASLGILASDISLPVAAEWAGARLEVLFRTLDPDALFYIKYTSYTADCASLMAVSNSNAIPAGIYTAVFLTAVFAFILSVTIDSPDWSLAVLAVMAYLTLFWYLFCVFGPYFLPDNVVSMVDDRLFTAVILLLMVLYFVLNRSGSFWKHLGGALAAALIFVAVLLVVLELGWTDRARALESEIVLTLRGELPISWLMPYVTVLCVAVSLYGIIRRRLAARNEAMAISVRQATLAESYHTIERSYAETANLRHDWKNQITALNLLYQEGEYEKLGQRLREMDTSVDRLRLPTFSDCFIVNAILQNAASRASDEGVEFRAQAPLPEHVDVDEGDICSFLMNMLDNAIDAARAVPEGQKRFVDVTVRINRGYLAISCRNSYSGTVEMDDRGFPKTTKSPDEGHGLGVRQMEQISKKYGSKLDLGCDEGVFTVQTAFRLRSENKAAPVKTGAD